MKVHGLTREHDFTVAALDDGLRFHVRIDCECGSQWFVESIESLASVARGHQAFIDAFIGQPEYQAVICRV